jgi:hypothetical protein
MVLGKFTQHAALSVTFRVSMAVPTTCAAVRSMALSMPTGVRMLMRVRRARRTRVALVVRQTSRTAVAAVIIAGNTGSHGCTTAVTTLRPHEVRGYTLLSSVMVATMTNRILVQRQRSTVAVATAIRRRPVKAAASIAVAVAALVLCWLDTLQPQRRTPPTDPVLDRRSTLRRYGSAVIATTLWMTSRSAVRSAVTDTIVTIVGTMAAASIGITIAGTVGTIVPSTVHTRMTLAASLAARTPCTSIPKLSFPSSRCRQMPVTMRRCPLRLRRGSLTTTMLAERSV